MGRTKQEQEAIDTISRKNGIKPSSFIYLVTSGTIVIRIVLENYTVSQPALFVISDALMIGARCC